MECTIFTDLNVSEKKLIQQNTSKMRNMCLFLQHKHSDFTFFNGSWVL